MSSAKILTFMMLVFFSLPVFADAYKLKEGDLIQVSVWGEETLNKTIRVLPDGTISFPLAGNMKVAGLTAPQVENLVANKLTRFLADPTVSVVFEATDGNRVYVLGKVMRPGALAMTTPLTVTQALSLSGGLGKFAEEDQILILRKANGKKTQLKVKYSEIITGKDISTDHDLVAGDTILVP